MVERVELKEDRLPHQLENWLEEPQTVGQYYNGKQQYNHNRYVSGTRRKTGDYQHNVDH